MKLGYDDIRGVVGLVRTPPRDGAERWAALEREFACATV